MTRYLPIVLFSLLAGVAAPGAPHVLVWFDFDGENVPTGPYTLTAYEDAKGSVSVTGTYRYSGYRSVEIQDVAGDGEFAELQGFFPEKKTGMLLFHFALMIAEPRESMNVALAGEGHFRMEKDGFGFWLKARDGYFRHVTAAREKKLFRIEPFLWYVIDVAYDVDRGTYDLTVYAEGEGEPRVSLAGQANPVGLAGSKIHKFSFIGDTPGRDRSKARFYVDDILVTADEPAHQGPFVAPGRRMMFVDLYDYYRSLLYERPKCLPVLEPEDLGFSSRDIEDLARMGQLQLYDDLADRKGGTEAIPQKIPPSLRPRLKAIVLWRDGCAAPAGCKSPCALDFFREAAERVSDAKMYPMSEVLALATENRWKEADVLFLSLYSDWEDDPRFPSICAILGMARGDLEAAEQWLESAVDSLPPVYRHPLIRRLWSGEVDQALVRGLQAEFPSQWPDYVEGALVAEQRYYVLLWQNRLREALDYAGRMVVRYREMGLAEGKWLERQGDAMFRSGDYVGALQQYEESIGRKNNADSVYLKLSDVHFMLGNLAEEREYREKIYGSLAH